MVLERAGFTVLTAATAGEAMRLVRAQLRQRIDLVLTDYYLDGVSGGELARAIKDIDPHLNVAIYSGADDLPADAGNADRIIPKADGASALVGCIHSLLEGKRRAA
jgi:CheY-like chemotaxis protein